MDIDRDENPHNKSVSLIVVALPVAVAVLALLLSGRMTSELSTARRLLAKQGYRAVIAIPRCSLARASGSLLAAADGVMCERHHERQSFYLTIVSQLLERVIDTCRDCEPSDECFA